MKFSTPREIVESSGGRISLSTIYGLVRGGRLPCYRIGCRGAGKYLIRDDDWVAFVESCRVSDWPDEGGFEYLK